MPGLPGGIPIYPGHRGVQPAPGHAYSGDRSDFGRVFRAPRPFRIAPYQRPHGWYAHRWRYGEFLPAPFWARPYWILNYWLYQLAPPPYGYVWVRYGTDALLIDQRTGEVVEVIYDAFYY